MKFNLMQSSYPLKKFSNFRVVRVTMQHPANISSYIYKEFIVVEKAEPMED